LVSASPVLAGADGKTTGHGQPLSYGDIAPWDIDIRYDGAGLPEGGGTVAKGEDIFAERCAACHGDFGEGLGRNPGLFGGIGSLGGDNPQRKVGSYWPYAPVLFDYIRRAMPFGDAQSLSANETYSLTALVLNMNGLWDDESVLDRAALANIRMPNRDGFVTRTSGPDTASFRCMSDCRGTVKVRSRAELIRNSNSSGAPE
jgi:cytochrome c